MFDPCSYILYFRIEQYSAIFDHITVHLQHCESIQADPVMCRQAATRHGFSNVLVFNKYISNVECMMRCLQYVALDALIHGSMEALEADPKYWKKWAEHMRNKAKDWFSEWSSDRPPLNSTMPWQVKPSLVVLWGVCWMFYTPKEFAKDSRRISQQSWHSPNQNTNWIPQTTISASEQAMSKLILKIKNHERSC